MTYDVGSDERLTWWTMRVQTRLRLVGTPWVHSHRARYAGLLVLRNGPRTPWQLSPLVVDSASCVHRRVPECLSVGALRAHLESKARALPSPGRRSVLLCADEPTAANWELARTAGGATIHADRQGEAHCLSGEELEEGDTLTVFAFTRPNYNGGLDSFPQHTLLFSHAELPPYPGDPSDTTSSNGTWASSSGGAWDPAKAVFVAPQPSNGDEYGVWHLETGHLEHPTLLPPRKGST